MIYKQKKSKYFWMKVTHNGQTYRRSTQVTGKREAQRIEAAFRTALARQDVGIIERKLAPTLGDFLRCDFMPFIRTDRADHPKTVSYYANGVLNICRFQRLEQTRLDAITTTLVTEYASARRTDGLATASVNRELEVLRRALKLALEWGRFPGPMPKIRIDRAGERRRERVITSEEEGRYFAVAEPLVRDVAAILVDCGLRPEEAFRLRWEEYRDGALNIAHGKTANARRRVHVTPRVAALLESRRSESPWIFPAPTRSGHIEPSSVRGQHKRACTLAAVEQFELYTLRHTCLTRWAPHMDPYTLHRLAGHADMATTKRYVHPQEQTVRDALERARAAMGHTMGIPAMPPADKGVPKEGLIN